MALSILPILHVPAVIKTTDTKTTNRIKCPHIKTYMQGFLFEPNTYHLVCCACNHVLDSSDIRVFY